MRTCKAQCCKKGYLPVSSKEATLFETTDLQIPLTPKCRFLHRNTCAIYENRPSACREFPLYEKMKTVLVASWCEGYKAGLLDNYLNILEESGCKIIIV